MKELGERIAQLRKAQGMTQGRFAELLGVSFQAVSNWERGETAPELERMTAIAKALNTTVSSLLEEDFRPVVGAVGEKLYDEERMFTYVKTMALSHRLDQTCRALPFAREQHAGQFRKGSGQVPYIVHPLNMACHALAMGLLEDDLLATVLLHDVCEDCGVAPEELPVGERVQKAVALLTFRREVGETKHEAKARYFAVLSECPEAVMAKLLDRCNNVTFMAHGFTPEKLREYIAETREFVLPLLRQARREYPQYNNALYLLKYQICGVIDSLDAMLHRSGS